MVKAVDGQKGDYHQMKTDLTDGNDNPLTWTLKKEDDGYIQIEYWEAKGSDDKIYKVKQDAPYSLEGHVEVEAVV